MTNAQVLDNKGIYIDKLMDEGICEKYLECLTCGRDIFNIYRNPLTKFMEISCCYCGKTDNYQYKTNVFRTKDGIQI